MKSIIVAFATLCLLVSTQPAAAGTLYAATDFEEFGGTPPFLPTIPDRLARGTTVGPTVPGGFAILNPTDAALGGAFVPVNGLGQGVGFLYAGQPQFVPPGFPGNTLRTLDFNGNVLTSVVGNFAVGCCNEEMVEFGGSLYHATFPNIIQELNPATGVVLNTFAQNEVVGMAVINNQIWISKWTPRLVGTWNPIGNVFVPKFSTVGLNAGLAGCLAWDPVRSVLWVGFTGGNLVPSDLAGNSLGATIQPIPGVTTTIDGCAIFFETAIKTDVKPESNPNCVNPNSRGRISVAYFGSDTLDVADIDQTTLEWGAASPVRCAFEDAVMEGAGIDGFTDLVCKYKTSDVALPESPENCVIVGGGGLLLDGTEFVASDHVCVVGEPVCDASTPQ